ncbi:hypothetical protein [Thiomicrorhabdus aquaedulcis]|uniref:hypothetical protein n=1 Tax=Thiomicrorhabdus aquaedulcis TaxID=2211106 RepID=UPI000FDA993B|nr:hypothetical protein [Thiomicrorhabdus aquaedulcis]
MFNDEVEALAKTRQAALDQAFASHRNRFSKGRPKVKFPPKEVCINPIPEDADAQMLESGVNFSTLPRARQNAI